MTEERQSTHRVNWSIVAVKNIGAAIAVVVVVLGILGYVYSFGQVSNSVEQDLDRNCRFLAIIEADAQFIIIKQTNTTAEANAFREIFRNSTRDTCG